ncbi:Hypothetical protein CUL131002_2114c [Corynebacterium ulcerans]|nr:Hypothetical protein CUL131002_2114c [Corynebacterium ulcerans]
MSASFHGCCLWDSAGINPEFCLVATPIEKDVGVAFAMEVLGLEGRREAC